MSRRAEESANQLISQGFVIKGATFYEDMRLNENVAFELIQKNKYNTWSAKPLSKSFQHKLVQIVTGDNLYLCMGLRFMAAFMKAL